MRIVILTVNHMYANKLVKDVLTKFGKDVKLIIESDSLLYKKSLVDSLSKYIQISGLYYVFNQAIKLEIYKVLSFVFSKFDLGKTDSKFFHFERLAGRLRIKVKKIFNVNSNEGLSLLKRQKPDLIVSVLFNQLLGEKVIKLPKCGVINIHPAYLPDYKGVSPVFWALSNSEKEAGVSVHYIDKGIDTGSILARKKLEVEKEDTEDSLYWRLVQVGAPLLISVIEDIASKKKIKGMRNSGGRYFSLPTKKAVKKYTKRRVFFRLKDVLYQL